MPASIKRFKAEVGSEDYGTCQRK